MPNEPLPPDLEAMARETCVVLNNLNHDDEIPHGRCADCQTLLVFAQRVQRETVEQACAAVPTNWVDPILSGPNSPLRIGHQWGCREIEHVIQAIERAIRAAFEPGKEGK